MKEVTKLQKGQDYWKWKQTSHHPKILKWKKSSCKMDLVIFLDIRTNNYWLERVNLVRLFRCYWIRLLMVIIRRTINSPFKPCSISSILCFAGTVLCHNISNMNCCWSTNALAVLKNTFIRWISFINRCGCWKVSSINYWKIPLIPSIWRNSAIRKIMFSDLWNVSNLETNFQVLVFLCLQGELHNHPFTCGLNSIRSLYTTNLTLLIIF